MRIFHLSQQLKPLPRKRCSEFSGQKGEPKLPCFNGFPLWKKGPMDFTPLKKGPIDSTLWKRGPGGISQAHAVFKIPLNPPFSKGDSENPPESPFFKGELLWPLALSSMPYGTIIKGGKVNCFFKGGLAGSSPA